MTLQAGSTVAIPVDSAETWTAGTLSRLSTEELLEAADQTSRQVAAATGRLLAVAGELDRREGWRAEGATSLAAWLVERTGVSASTARAQAHVAERLFDLPHLAGALSTGSIAFDKVRAVADTATPEDDAAFAEAAGSQSVRELAELTRARRRPHAHQDQAEFEHRSVRFNDACRTMTAQLPAETYAEVRGALEAGARALPSDGETPWDHRLADALIGLVRATGTGPGRAQANHFTVVAHVPMEALVDKSSQLAGELERGGFVSAETIRRVACDSTIVIAVDDDVGHTMYAGRTRRVPNAAQRREILRRDRHCRFPGCTNVTFAHPHHIKRWKPDGGTTDLWNLALLCDHHHHLMHSNAWTMSGDANQELTFIGPTGRVMTSRPAALWTNSSGGQAAL